MTAPARRRPARAAPARVLAFLLVLAAGAVFAASPARADLKKLEAEFRDAIEKTSAVTVVVVPSEAGIAPGVSGVIVAKSGLVLTTSDAGRYYEIRDRKPVALSKDEVEIRVPDLKKGSFTNYHGRIVKRFPEISSALVALSDAPKSGFPSWLVPATSADLRVGAFTFVMGNSFGMSAESPPSLTAGVVASLVRRTGSTDQGLHDFVYTTAAVNPGVAGGPLVDVRGRLVGIVAGWVDAGAEQDSPYQFLGRAIPVDRLRASYAGVPEAKGVFEAPPPKDLRVEDAPAMEAVIGRVAADARAGVVSLEIQRKVPVFARAIGPDGRPVDLPRYRGPCSGLVASEDGIVVTALYNLTNLVTLVSPGAGQLLPPEATTKAGIDAIDGATVVLPDGTAVPAKLIGVNEPAGLAAFRAELPAGTKLRTFTPAPPESFAEGRFVVSLGNPFGRAGNPDPLVTFGILSKQHADDAPAPWRGHWQTDARGTDGNCGGAIVDLRGRIFGMHTLWDPAHHGRASGISFVLPWERILKELPDLAAGKSRRRPFLGISWDPAAKDAARILGVIAGTAAAGAGIREGDEIIALDETEVKSASDFAAAISKRWAGDAVKVKIRRGPDVITIELTLGTRD